MNNKGQSLVLFILILPILLGSIVLVIDVGNAIVMKNKINNIIEMVIEDGLENDYSEEELNNLMDYNLDSDYVVKLDNNLIEIKVESYSEGIFSNMFSFEGFKIISQYEGYMKDNKKVIEKVK